MFFFILFEEIYLNADKMEFVPLTSFLDKLNFCVSPDFLAKIWKSASPVPTGAELLGPLLEAEASLPQVNIETPYLGGEILGPHFCFALRNVTSMIDPL